MDIVKQRMKMYGDPSKNWDRTAYLASLLVGKELSEGDCIKVLFAAKLCRSLTTYKKDNVRDFDGYRDILENYIKKQKK